MYYVYAGYNGTYDSSHKAYRGISKFGYAVINITNNELVAHNITSCNFDPVKSKSYISNNQYSAILQTVGYNFDTDTFYGLWYTTNYGWSANFICGITTYKNNGTLTHKQCTHSNGWNYRTIKSSIWNSTDNNFICRLGCWQSGKTTYYRILFKLTVDDAVTELITNTTEKSIWWSNQESGYGRVIMIKNDVDTTPIYKPFNTATKSYLGPVGTSNSYRLLQCGDDAIFEGRDSADSEIYNIYKFNASDNTYTKIVEGANRSAQLYMYYIDGEYKFKHNNVVYNMDGAEYDMILPSNISSYRTRIMKINNDVITDIFSTSYSTNKGTITVTNYTFTMALYRNIISFPITGTLCIAISGKNTNTGENDVYKYSCFELNTISYDGTVSPSEYKTALNTAKQIEGSVE